MAVTLLAVSIIGANGTGYKSRVISFSQIARAYAYSLFCHIPPSNVIALSHF